ncbi:oxidoreductase [Candidatus Marinamargulisbacteria bacterium SCGC AG-410-N11]|nr:oxidoreductase [Candidatus Marinamargulisbacteria bacterium SCGC AG-410-N11]
MSNLKVAVIGVGNMGKHHARNYTQIKNVTLVSVCDIQESVANELATQYNCKAYTCLNKMIENENLDAVSITAPTRYHYEIAKVVIKNNINLLIEKPISDNIEKSNELIKLAKKNNLTLMIGHIERFNPAVTKLKEIIDEGKLGKITSLISKRVGAFPAQIKDANVIIDLAVHDIDIFSYLLNKNPNQIYGNAGRALNSNREDYAEIFLTYGDQNAFIQVNWITPIRIRNLAITGTKGYAELNYMTQELTVYESNYSSDFDTFGDYIIKFGNPTKKNISLEKKEPLANELNHFINCIQTKSTPLITGENGKKALEIALKVMEKMQISIKK